MATPSASNVAAFPARFQLKVVSPEREVFAAPVWQVTIPGSEGEFGVRAGHTALLTALKAGTIQIREHETAAPVEFRVPGGFADVTAAQCTILCEAIENA